MKEIGGYIELEGWHKREYHNEAIPLNLARNCLIYIIKAKKIEKIYLPYYLCDSVEKVKDYCEIEYYKIGENFMPLKCDKMKSNEYIYIVNYFGQLSNRTINNLKKLYVNIIVDNVQAFFQRPIKGIDTIYSCRKFFGVSDGAYLYTNTKLNEDIDNDTSVDRLEHLLGRADIDAQTYFKKHQENEKNLDSLQLKNMSKLTHILMKTVEYRKVKKIRTRNYEYLYKMLKKTNRIKLKNIKGAYVYPYYTEDAEFIKEKLKLKKIYIPTLWPNVLNLKDIDEIGYNFAKNILPLPVDQRYKKEDMLYIYEAIKEYGGKNV